MSRPSGYALFDLDHTLLPHDTQALFCNYVLRRERWRTLLHLLFVPFAVLKALRLISTLRAKRAFMGYLWGMPLPRLRGYANDFARRSAKAWAYPDLLAIVAQHRAAGHVLVLNTASPSFYAEDIAAALGFDHCIATSTTLADPLALHPVIAENNKKEAKIGAMLARVPGLAALSETERKEMSWAYSDSAADLPLLEFAGRAVLVHPSPTLANYGRRQDWSMVKPARPYRNKIGDMLAVLRQMLGCYPEQPKA